MPCFARQPRLDRRAPRHCASVPSARQACSVAMFFEPSSDQTCMWWTSRTPATLASMIAGDAVAVEVGRHAFEQHMGGSRISDHARATGCSSATSTDRIGSIGVQPVAMMTSAATIAATEPSMSPSTCRIAPRMLRLSRSPPCSTKKPAMLTSKPEPPRRPASARRAPAPGRGSAARPRRRSTARWRRWRGRWCRRPASSRGRSRRSAAPSPRGRQGGTHTRRAPARPNRSACGRHRRAAPASR